MWGKVLGYFLRRIHTNLSSIMRHQFSALVTGEILVWAFGHLFLFTVCWWAVFVISLVKRTWGSCSQLVGRLAKYWISKNQSSLGFICILSAVICHLQGNQLVQIYFFFLQAALILDDTRYCIWDLYRLEQWNFSDVTLFFLLKSNRNNIQICHVTVKCTLPKCRCFL